MAKITTQHAIQNRIQKAAPRLKFVAVYNTDEKQLAAYMQAYKDRSIVYILSTEYKNEEYFLYVGQTQSQYARHFRHLKRFVFDKIYLFECDTEFLRESETALIAELLPLFNKNNNPLAHRFEKILGIKYSGLQAKKAIHKYLDRFIRYQAMGLFGFALPLDLYAAVARRAETEKCTESELLQTVLEHEFGKEAANILAYEDMSDQYTNLISAESFGKLHGHSKEQVKIYLRQGDRIPGSVKIGRDWILVKDTPFPQDRRGRRLQKNPNQ